MDIEYEGGALVVIGDREQRGVVWLCDVLGRWEGWEVGKLGLFWEEWCGVVWGEGEEGGKEEDGEEVMRDAREGRGFKEELVLGGYERRARAVDRRVDGVEEGRRTKLRGG